MKGPQYKITNEVNRGSSEQGQKVKQVGEALTPQGYEYLGSIAIHLYKSVFASSVVVGTQQLLGEKVDATTANWALQQGSKAIARDYGWVDPATRQDVLKKEE
jgi:hypothetical protein